MGHPQVVQFEASAEVLRFAKDDSDLS